MNTPHDWETLHLTRAEIRERAEHARVCSLPFGHEGGHWWDEEQEPPPISTANLPNRPTEE